MERAFLKSRGKMAFKANYWYCVLVSFILSMFVSGGTASGTSSVDSITDDIRSGTKSVGDAVGSYIDGRSFILSIGLIMVALLILVIGLFVSVFLLNVLEVGGCRFYIENARKNGQVDQLLYGFRDGRYGMVVVTQFLRALYVFLWGLLFVIPGIIKAYSYSLVPYILADNPDMTTKEVLELSKQMMEGNKWNLFVLELSFIGWEMLNVCTFGLLGVFYIRPYKDATKAEFYFSLRYRY